MFGRRREDKPKKEDWYIMVGFKQKCARPNCKNYFNVGKDKSSIGRLYCDEHGYRLASNNPKGNNQHIIQEVKPTPKTDLYEYYTHEEKFNEIKELGNTIWRKKCELLKIQIDFRKKQIDFFGWDWKKEFK